MKIVIAGANGFVGRHLREYFARHTLVLLTRHPRQAEHFWDPAQGILDPKLIEGADVVINLAGESIVGRWSAAKLERIAQSRYQATKLLAYTLSKVPVKLYLGASAIGYYGGDRAEMWLNETSSSGPGVLAPICQQWEDLHQSVTCERGIIARFGVILGHGGMLSKVAPLFRLGLGGVLGSGLQWMSWIAMQDVCEMIKFCIEEPNLTGPVNFVAPEPVTNFQWTKMLGQILRRPTWFHVPKWVITGLMGSSSEIVLGSLRVRPQKILDKKYHFNCSSLDQALENLF